MAHTLRKRRFWQISLNSASAMRASKKSSIITNRKSTMRFSLSHRWTLYVNPEFPKTRICTYYCVAFYIFVAGNHRHYKFGMPIDQCKSQPTDDKLSLKWAWSRHVIHFEFQGPKHIWGITEARIVKFLTLASNVTIRTTYHPLNGRGYGHVMIRLFKMTAAGLVNQIFGCFYLEFDFWVMLMHIFQKFHTII